LNRRGERLLNDRGCQPAPLPFRPVLFAMHAFVTHRQDI
jgi:hypothetical protein